MIYASSASLLEDLDKGRRKRFKFPRLGAKFRQRFHRLPKWLLPEEDGLSTKTTIQGFSVRRPGLRKEQTLQVHSIGRRDTKEGISSFAALVINRREGPKP
ncbi:hypothetical protein NPIL_133351 [Nephila pilipes]|uniref:Uncharacterized protein n=1 Tax=Nephila pilipes TaxID=299642 RepID=A0A8X6QF60_NEPPI|nr:hypothetical protein NPIL_133351 [Nephila pilipes]